MVSLAIGNKKIEDVEFVIFDKDGTFIDIHKYWGRVVELRARAIMRYFVLNNDFYKPLCSVMGYDLETKKLPFDSPVGLYARGMVQEILLYFLVSKDVEASLEDIERVFQEVSQEFVDEQDEYTDIIPEAISLMERLEKSGVKMVVVTSDSKKNAIRTVKMLGLDKFFAGVYGAQDSETSKTTGEIVKKIMTEFSMDLDKTVCIGDTYDDFMMAKNSGIKACINVSTGVVTTSQHQEYNEFCVTSLDEVLVE